MWQGRRNLLPELPRFDHLDGVHRCLLVESAWKGGNLLFISYTLYSGLRYSWDAELLYRESPAMPRKQLNLTLTLEQYAAVQAAAAEDGVKVAVYCRDAILAQAMPEPELPDSATLPAWLLHFLLFVTRGKARPV